MFRSGLWMPVPDAITSAVRPRRSAKTLQAGGIFQKVVGGGNAGGGFGHRGGDLAGSGDVLTGLIAALLGQGLEAFAAAQLGAYTHGLAGDLAKADHGEVGLIASDILERLPRALKALAG